MFDFQRQSFLNTYNSVVRYQSVNLKLRFYSYIYSIKFNWITVKKCILSKTRLLKFTIGALCTIVHQFIY